jgi:hypothetical protein
LWNTFDRVELRVRSEIVDDGKIGFIGDAEEDFTWRPRGAPTWSRGKAQVSELFALLVSYLVGVLKSAQAHRL